MTRAARSATAARQPGTTPAGAPRARGRGVLLVIAILFAASGAIRLGSDGYAYAKAGADAVAPEPLACEPDAGTAALLAALKERAVALAEREAAVADRAQALALAEEQIGARLAELTAAEEKLAATLARADTAADEDVARLVAVYENMKPKDAAKLFAEMAPEFAAGFLGRMRPDAAAAVMAGLDSKAAYAISAVLAGRNAAAPKG